MTTSMRYAMEEAFLVRFEVSVSTLTKFAHQMAEAMRPVLETLAELARKFTDAVRQLQDSRTVTAPTPPASPGAVSAVVAEQHSALGRAGRPGRRWRGRR